MTILTSGTTGEPKAVRHSWEGLFRPVRASKTQSSPKWLLSYRPHLYAGLQVALQCFADHGTLAICPHDASPRFLAEFLVSAKVEYVSATPSYWRRLLMFGDAETLKQLSLAQITLGGEVVDQQILDKLRHYFPKARIVHIYATTEAGRCFSVDDGMAGFPVAYLQQARLDGTELRLQDSELLIRSPNSMKTYDPHSSKRNSVQDWFATGDVVTLTNDRVYFIGRKSEMINVAGSKVFPIEVEKVIRLVPGVEDVRVFGKSSSIAGQLVACEIVAQDEENLEALKKRVTKTCLDRLTSYQRPRSISFVEKLSLSSAGKTSRASR